MDENKIYTLLNLLTFAFIREPSINAKVSAQASRHPKVCYPYLSISGYASYNYSFLLLRLFLVLQNANTYNV